MTSGQLAVFTTGGTIDKIYFDALSEFQIGETALESIFREANVTFGIQITSLMKKDSLELTDEDRTTICNAIRASDCKSILVTHGTDTMVQTALALGEVTDKSVVFTGAMQPASQRRSDAIFNIGFAVSATQIAPPGTYIAINGHLFDPRHARKNRGEQRFEEV